MSLLRIVSLLRPRDPRRRAPDGPRNLPLGDQNRGLLADLHQHNAHGYGPWGAGLRHRVEDALGWHDDTEQRP